MGKTYLRRLTARHFRSIKGEVSVTFPERGMVLIRSKNHDTGGSSGGGKSALLMALNAALDCSPYPMTELQSWGVEEPLQVVLEMEHDTFGSVVVQRGAKSSLKIGSERALTGARAISAKLQEVLGLSPDMLLALTYAPQQEPDDFLTKTNAAKQAFLSTLLNLQPFEDAVEAAKQALRAAENEGVSSELALGVYARAHDVAKAAVTALPQIDTELVPRLEAALKAATEIIATKQKAVDAAQTALGERESAVREQTDGVQRRLGPRLQEAQEAIRAVPAAPAAQPPSPEIQRLRTLMQMGDKKLQEARSADAVRERQFRSDCQRIDTDLATAIQVAKGIPALKAQIDGFLAQIAKLEASVCPTCDRQWDAAKDQITSLRSKAEELCRRLRDAQTSEANVALYRSERAALKFEPDPVIAQIQGAIETFKSQLATAEAEAAQAQRVAAANLSALRAQAQSAYNALYAEYLGLVSDIKSQMEPAIQAARQRLHEAKTELQAAQMTQVQARHAVAEAEQAIHYATTSAETTQAHFAKAAAEYEAAQARHASIGKKVAAEQDFIRMIGREGFLGAIFDEVLQEISAETNAILGRVANTAHIVLEFRSEVESQDGKVRKEIRPVVTIGGHEAALKSGCSGGMYTAVRLAVRIAVRRVISRRVGAFPCWLSLDESFEGLDHVSKEACMEVLAEAAQEDLILVVDHSSEFKELFTQFIDLEYRDGTTTLVGAP
jgi:DNA repair exonuclease SbcCD ATPase subunit